MCRVWLVSGCHVEVAWYPNSLLGCAWDVLCVVVIEHCWIVGHGLSSLQLEQQETVETFAFYHNRLLSGAVHAHQISRCVARLKNMQTRSSGGGGGMHHNISTSVRHISQNYKHTSLIVKYLKCVRKYGRSSRVQSNQRKKEAGYRSARYMI